MIFWFMADWARRRIESWSAFLIDVMLKYIWAPFSLFAEVPSWGMNWPVLPLPLNSRRHIMCEELWLDILLALSSDNGDHQWMVKVIQAYSSELMADFSFQRLKMSTVEHFDPKLYTFASLRHVLYSCFKGGCSDWGCCSLNTTLIKPRLDVIVWSTAKVGHLSLAGDKGDILIHLLNCIQKVWILRLRADVRDVHLCQMGVSIVNGEVKTLHNHFNRNPK